MTDLELYFIFKSTKGLEERGFSNNPEYVQRLNHEISVITQMHFCGYFLIVQDIINWCKANNIYISPGRGSGAGSIVCYSLGITNVDPIRFKLIFERFLNPSRVSMPDLDLDFQKDKRDQVCDYIIHRFGQNHVAHIGTFNLMRAKGTIRDICRTLGHPYEIGDKLAKLTLPPVHGKPQLLSASLTQVADLRSYKNNKGSTEEEILTWAEKLENTIRGAGAHASGIVISNTPLTETVPLFVSNGDLITTQWEMTNIEEVGLIKFDILGLDALTKIHKCIDLIKETNNLDIDINSIPLDDEKVFSLLRAGESEKLFQLDASHGMRDLLVRIKPCVIEDIMTLIAIFRPGPLGSPEIENYLLARAGQIKPRYLVPELEPILKSTNGLIIFQEQVMQISRELCGYSMVESDDMRSAIGKKKLDKMKKHEDKFKKGWKEHGLDPIKGDILWDQLISFAAYSFNQSHAAAYAIITYQTAWLKVHYPAEYMCAVMSSEGGNQDDIIKSIAECKRIKIPVLPPDINISDISFGLDKDKNIRFGLGAIKNIGPSVAEQIIQERKKNGPFSDINSFCSRVDLGIVNKAKLESLARAGVFNSFGLSRAALLLNIEENLQYRKELKSYKNKILTYEKRILEYQKRLEDIKQDKLSDTEKKLKSLTLPTKPEPPELPKMLNCSELPEAEIQSNEHTLLGCYITSHPLDKIGKKVFGKILSSIEDTKQMLSKDRISIGAIVTNVAEIITKTNKKMAYLTLEDLTGTTEAVCIPKIYEESKFLLGEIRPLKIDGYIQITEGEEGGTTKILITHISPLDIKETKTETIEARVQLDKSRELMSILKKYSGNKHKVSITLKATDGTSFKIKEQFRINEEKGSFTRELLRLKW